MNKLHDHSDKQLVSLLVGGDDCAFEIIYRRYVKELYSYVRKRISLEEDSEEIIQLVFESLWKRRRELGYILELKRYLYGSARLRAIRYLRDEQLRKKRQEYFNLFEAVYDSSPTEIQIDVDQLSKLINNAIEDLPSRCREAVKLRVAENLSDEEIALRMQVNKRTAQNYLATAFAHFRSIYRKSLATSLTILFLIGAYCFSITPTSASKTYFDLFRYSFPSMSLIEKSTLTENAP